MRPCAFSPWMMLTYGFGGMRDDDGTLSFWPRRAPEDNAILRFPLTYRGQMLEVEIGLEKVEYAFCEYWEDYRRQRAERPFSELFAEALERVSPTGEAALAADLIFACLFCCSFIRLRRPTTASASASIFVTASRNTGP